MESISFAIRHSDFWMHSAISKSYEDIGTLSVGRFANLIFFVLRPTSNDDSLLLFFFTHNHFLTHFGYRLLRNWFLFTQRVKIFDRFRLVTWAICEEHRRVRPSYNIYLKVISEAMSLL